MAFDMYCGNKREKIDHHEESIFTYANDSDVLPELKKLWESFYDGPIIYPENSNRIVHELILLRSMLGPTGNKIHMKLIDRLLLLFSHSYSSGEPVKCVSD